MLSVIVVNFNTREYLRKCLTSLRAHEPGAQLIVVDNASRDGSAEMVAQDFPDVALFAEKKNLGFAAGNNVGLKAATGDYVVLFNSDAELRDAALTQCVAAMEADPSIGAVHPALEGPDGLPQIAEHNFPSLGSMFRDALRLKNKRPGSLENRWLAGTALVIRKKALDSIGGKLDDSYFMYWEDADLSAKLKKAGWKLELVPGATVKHHGGASGGGADTARRADLHAWFCYGKHRWFRSNRPRWEAAAVWMMDLVDVPRKTLRGLAKHSARYSEWAQAKVTAQVLFGSLTGAKPPLPRGA
ncbi:glycosyltransferase family 2 protein [Telmatocola sphagniphila]|uniref:Glycosyltransferase family 2 protein n=1 Tax=Telmatocola sphagniphila TaxID=1123043 RepID=A0A8E6ET31_9BACT|nr:glycosyltransferase family 2 protein [Telmatocola sphagniphila]QVL31864.1 glycosyltransferase family 2 protein [Telmatocola sphagniphila]